MPTNKSVIRQDFDLLKPQVKLKKFSIREFRNGVIVRMPNHLGDAVMALPALQVLKSILPEHCGLFVVTPANIMQLYQTLPCVDDIVPLAEPHKFWSMDEIRMVKQLRCGAAVLLNHSFRDALCFKLAGVPELFGEATRFRGFLLKGKFSFPKHRRGKYSSSHQTMRYLAVAEALGGKIPQQYMPELTVPCSADELSGPVSSLFFHPAILVLAPGAAYGAAKRWPHEYYTKVADYWIRRGGIVALCGSRGESGICNDIAKWLPAEKCFDLSGKTDLFALIWLFRFASAAVTNDSGLMHLAAASGCCGITVFGPTDLYDTGPVSDRWFMLHERESCAPCLCRSCPKGNPVCTLKMTPAKVIRVLHKLAKDKNVPLKKNLK